MFKVSMKFAFVMNKLETINPKSDTTLLFIEESLRRGHEVFFLSHDDLVLYNNKPFGIVKKWKLKDSNLETLDFFDAIFLRHDPPFDEKYLTTTYMFDFISDKTFVINSASGLRFANEKIYSLKFPNFTPQTIITASAAEIRKFLDEHKGRAIIKPIYLMAGHGIFLIRDDDPNLSSIIEGATDYGTKHIVVQEYLKEAQEGDKRILLLNGKPIGAMTRIPKPGESRANLRSGSTCVKATITERELSICDAMAPSLIRDGLYFAGIDIIGGHLTEVNVTSPTGMQQINRLENVQLEKQIIDFVESRARASS
jgi:glutathione synthase